MSVYRPRSNENFYTNFVVAGKRYTKSTGTSDKRDAEAFERELKERKKREHANADNLGDEVASIEAALEKKTGVRLDLKNLINPIAAIEMALELKTGVRLDLQSLQTTDDFIKLAHQQKLRKDVPRLPLADVWGIYRDSPLKTRKQSPKTSRQYRSYWEKLVAWLQNKYPDIKFMDEIDDTIASQFMSVVQRSGLSERSFNSRLISLRHIFKITAKKAGIVSNPFSTIAIHEYARDTVSREDFSADQLKKIEKAVAGNEAMRRYLMVLCYTGLRAGDAATLLWDEVDLDEGFINRMTRKTRTIVNIPIMGNLKEELEALKKVAKRTQRYVFPELAAAYEKDASVPGKRFKKILKTAGIEGQVDLSGRGRKRKASVYDLHSFRHTFAAICGRQHVPIAVVQSILGHTDPKTTEIYQRHATAGDKRRAVETIPASLFASVTSKRKRLPAKKK